MTTLAKYIDETKQRKLADYKEELAAETEAVTAVLEAELEALKTRLVVEKEALQRKRKGQAVMQQNQIVNYAFTAALVAEVKQLFDETVAEMMTQPQYYTKWLKAQFDALPAELGRIRASKKVLLQLKSMVGQAEYELLEDASLETEPGFVFESDSRFIDASVTSFKEEWFAAHELDLYALVSE